MHQLAQRRAQFIVATHSPILMAYPNAIIYLFSEHGIRQVAYEETEHYQVTRNFLNHVDASLRELLRAEGELF
jgi:predicted ATPase